VVIDQYQCRPCRCAIPIFGPSNPDSVAYHSFSALLYISVVVALGSCGSSKELVTVLVEDPKGNTELIYMGSAEPANMVREVRYDAEGDSLAVTSLAEGVLHGEVMSFHPNGKRKEVTTYKEGKQTGAFKVYDLEGTLVFEGELNDGKKQGLWSYWYDETQMKQQCQYVNDVLSGKCTYWYIDGTVKREETYQDGKLVASKDL
jgi:antitoxin component YwqK of YwqJK toxin-antitoxin module